MTGAYPLRLVGNGQLALLRICNYGIGHAGLIGYCDTRVHVGHGRDGL